MWQMKKKLLPPKDQPTNITDMFDKFDLFFNDEFWGKVEKRNYLSESKVVWKGKNRLLLCR